MQHFPRQQSDMPFSSTRSDQPFLPVYLPRSASLRLQGCSGRLLRTFEREPPGLTCAASFVYCEKMVAILQAAPLIYALPFAALHQLTANVDTLVCQQTARVDIVPK